MITKDDAISKILKKGIHHIEFPFDTLDSELQDKAIEMQEELMQDKRFEWFRSGATVIFVDKQKISTMTKELATHYEMINNDEHLFDLDSPYYHEAEKFIVSKIFPNVDVWKEI